MRAARRLRRRNNNAYLEFEDDAGNSWMRLRRLRRGQRRPRWGRRQVRPRPATRTVVVDNTGSTGGYSQGSTSGVYGDLTTGDVQN
jgi:hypothetical protein